MARPNPALRTRADVERYFAACTNYEHATDFTYTRRAFDLGRVRAALAAVGHPERGLRIVHIAGTKGKGSTAMMVAAILRAAGRRVGLFTSPHLEQLTERWQVDGRPLGDRELVAEVNRLRPAIEAQRRAGHPLTFFDITTVLALDWFAQSRVDVAVLEVGLGGRLDSTNVVTPAVCALTPIDFDHQAQLGPTLAAIAREKAGIIKPRVPVAGARQLPPAGAVIRRTAAARRAPLCLVGTHVVLERSAGLSFRVRTWRAVYDELFLPVLGAHQQENAALAVTVIELLNELEDAGIGGEAVRDGLLAVRLPGRIEVVSDDPVVVLDSAHNPFALRALAATLDAAFPCRPRVLLGAFNRDKDIAGCLETILPGCRAAVFTTTTSERSADPADLAARARAPGSASRPELVETACDPAAALARVRALVRPGEVIVITGSFYLAGALRPALTRPAAATGARGGRGGSRRSATARPQSAPRRSGRRRRGRRPAAGAGRRRG